MQFLTGHGNFNAKLAGFELLENGRCRCLEEETVDHVLFRCRLGGRFRDRLVRVMCSDGGPWPCDVQKFVAGRVYFGAHTSIAKGVLG